MTSESRASQTGAEGLEALLDRFFNQSCKYSKMLGGTREEAQMDAAIEQTRNEIIALSTPEEPAGCRKVLRIAAYMADELNGEDIHEAAYERFVGRVGPDDGSDPSEDDYIDAFVAIANRAALGDR